MPKASHCNVGAGYSTPKIWDEAEDTKLLMGRHGAEIRTGAPSMSDAQGPSQALHFEDLFPDPEKLRQAEERFLMRMIIQQLGSTHVVPGSSRDRLVLALATVVQMCG